MHTEIDRAFSLDGQVAVVTGAGSGIGQEAARILALAGARIVAGDINEASLATTADLIRDAGGEIAIRQIDIASRDQVEDLATATIAWEGRIDIWVNCAAISPLHSILETDQLTAERTVSVNMLGTYWGCMAAGRAMAGKGGAIINISSAGGAKPVPNLAIYGMTKAAVNSLTWTAAAEFGPLGIRVNAIAPGWIETPAVEALYRTSEGEIDHALRDKVFADMADSTPLGRVGVPNDIAFAVLYFASRAGSFVTGQVLRVNGGESM